MKIINKFLILLMLAVPFVGCDDDDIAVSKITLDKSTLTLEVGQTGQLSATVMPDDATNKTVEWSSDNTSVATVNVNGLVTAIANGTANITAKADGKEAKCAVTVTPDDYATLINGTYKGPIKVKGMPTGDIDIPSATIDIVYKSKNVVTVKLNQELLTGIKVDIEGDINVSKSGDNFKTIGTIGSFKLNDAPMPTSVTIDGTFQPSGASHIDIGLTVGMPLTVSFDGQKQ